MTEWFLIILLWGGADQAAPTVIRFPVTSETACNTARTGLKFPPGTVTANSFKKAALKWKANDFLLSNAGAAAASDAAGTLPTVTSLDIGPTLTGHISQIMVLPSDKNSTEIATMAT